MTDETADATIARLKQEISELKKELNRRPMFFEGTTAGNWDWEVQTGNVTINNAWAEMIGYTAEELAPLTLSKWKSFCQPDDLHEATARLESHFRGETAHYEAEIRMRHKKGHWVWILDRGKVYERDREGKPIRMAGSHQEITGRKHADEALQQERNLFLEGPVTVFRWQKTEGFPIRYVSPNVTRLTGYSPEEFTSGIVAYTDLVHPDDLEQIVTEMASYASEAGRTSFEQEYRIFRKDGTILWLYEFTTIIRDDDGLITSFETYALDNSIRKQSEETIAFNRRFEHLISTLASQFINISAEHIDEMINHALQAIGAFLEADRSCIFQYYNNQKIMEKTHEWCAESITPYNHILKQLPSDNFEWLNAKLARNEMIIVPKVSELPDETDSGKEFLEKMEIKSLISIPLISGSTLSGFIGFDAVRQERQWSSSMVSSLLMAGGIITNALQRKQVKHLIQSELDLALKLSASQSFEETIQLCLQTAIELSRMDCGGVYLVNEAENCLKLVYTQGVSDGFITDVHLVSQSTPEFLLMTSGAPLYNDQEAPVQEGIYKAMREEGLKSSAILPVISKNQLVAVFTVASHSFGEVPDFARKALETVASHIGAAIIQARQEEEVRSVNRNLETLFGSVDDMLFVVGENGKIKHANSATIATLGYQLDELRTMTVLDVHPPELREQAQKRVAEMLSGTETICNIPLFRKSGDRLPAETKITHGIWNGQPVIFGISRDISERLKNQSRLVESERKFRELTEFLPLPLVETNRQGIVTYINNSGLEFFDLSHEELQQGISAFSFCSPEEFEMALASQTKMLVPGYIPKGNEYTVMMKDGRRLPLMLYSTPIRQGNGQVSGIRTTVVDLTELKRAEEALRENALQKRVSEEFRSIIDNIPGVVYHTSDDGVIKFLSQPADAASCDLLSLLSGTNDIAMSLVCPDDRQLVVDTYRELREAPASKVVLFKIVMPDGSIRWIEDRRTSLFSEHGKFSGIDGILFDITDRVKAQKEKQQLEQNLKKTQRIETIGTLAGGIAHDFNNILSPILGYAEMGVVSLSKDTKQHGYFNEIMMAAERAQHLVAQILAFSRAEEREPVVVNVKEIVSEALKLLRPSIPVTITIKKTIDEKCGNVLADPSQIHQVIVNLCTNAFQAMAESGGEMTIDLREIKPDEALLKRMPSLLAEGYIQLSIADTGHGMDEITMERIFEPFFTTKPVNKGTGLGLSVVHGIVTSYKGEITVESAPGKGCTFRIYLPVIESGVASPKHVSELSRGEQSTRILFVDDEEATVALMNVMLEYLGFSVLTVNSPVKALDEFRKEPAAFDMVITDLTMPEMTGIELAGELHEISPSLPVALMTGYGRDIENTVPLSQYGICKFLKKPVSLSNLSQVITEVMASAAHT
ncbi:MAG: PAS domain S-box protein [Chlorobiaceae bacterium]|nr:PAS domain S-box protein [Chlorobiaceae bacterium]